MFNKAIDDKKNIILEATLSGKSILNRYDKAVKSGYTVNTIYVGLDSLELHKERVKDRVDKGGHHIDDKLIEQRYKSNKENLYKAMEVSDLVIIYDNSDVTINRSMVLNNKVKMMRVNSNKDWVNEIANNLELDKGIKKIVELESNDLIVNNKQGALIMESNQNLTSQKTNELSSNEVLNEASKNFHKNSIGELKELISGLEKQGALVTGEYDPEKLKVSLNVRDGESPEKEIMFSMETAKMSNDILVSGKHTNEEFAYTFKEPMDSFEKQLILDQYSIEKREADINHIEKQNAPIEQSEVKNTDSEFIERNFLNPELASAVVGRLGGSREFMDTAENKSSSEYLNDYSFDSNREFYLENRTAINQMLEESSQIGDYEHKGYAILYASGNVKDMPSDEAIEQEGNRINDLINSNSALDDAKDIYVVETINKMVYETVTQEYENNNPTQDYIYQDQELTLESNTQAGLNQPDYDAFERDMDLYQQSELNTISNDNSHFQDNEQHFTEKLDAIQDHYKTSLDGVEIKDLKQGTFIYAVDTEKLETQQVKFTEAYNLTSVTKLPLVGNSVFDKEKGDYKTAFDLQPKEVVTKPLEKEELKSLLDQNKQAEQKLGINDQVKEKLGFEELVPSNVKTAYLIKAQTDKDFSFYDKSDTKLPAFEAHKNTLSTTKEDQATISAMLSVAKSQSWDSVKVTGTEEFRREAWLQASLQGISVKGYTPKENDMIELQARSELLDKNTITGYAKEQVKAPEAEKAPEAKANEPLEKLAGLAIAGKILDYGHAPYPDKPKSQSFFIEVQKEDGTKEKAWGLSLAEELKKTGAERGDKISMTKLDGEKVDILMPAKVKDANGNVTGIESKPFQVQAWNVGVLEKDKENQKEKSKGDLYVPKELSKDSVHAKINDHRDNLKQKMDTLNIKPEVASTVLKTFDTGIKTGHAVEKLEQLKPKNIELKENSKSDSKERDR